MAPHHRHTVTGPLPGSAPAHTVYPAAPSPRLLATVVAGALLLVVGVGAAVQLATGDPASSTPSSAQRMAVTPAAESGTSPSGR